MVACSVFLRHLFLPVVTVLLTYVKPSYAGDSRDACPVSKFHGNSLLQVQPVVSKSSRDYQETDYTDASGNWGQLEKVIVVGNSSHQSNGTTFRTSATHTTHLHQATKSDISSLSHMQGVTKATLQPLNKEVESHANKTSKNLQHQPRGVIHVKLTGVDTLLRHRHSMHLAAVMFVLGGMLISAGLFGLYAQHKECAQHS